MGGFGGSNKNLGIGCADGPHRQRRNPHRAWLRQSVVNRRRRADGAHDRIHQGDYRLLWDGIVYVNVMRNMSVSCDCEGTGAMPVVTPNAGILASTDICAIDSACVDLVYAMTEAGALRQPRPCRANRSAPWPCVSLIYAARAGEWATGNIACLAWTTAKRSRPSRSRCARKAPSRGNALQQNSSRTRVTRDAGAIPQCGTKKHKKGLQALRLQTPSGKSIRRSSD